MIWMKVTSYQWLIGHTYASTFSLGGRCSWIRIMAMPSTLLSNCVKWKKNSPFISSTFMASCMIPDQLHHNPTNGQIPYGILSWLSSIFSCGEASSNGLFAPILFACKSFKHCPQKLQNRTKAMRFFFIRGWNQLALNTTFEVYLLNYTLGLDACHGSRVWILRLSGIIFPCLIDIFKNN